MAAEESDLFDSLPDDLVISILSKLSSSAGCPSDFVNILMTCKKLNGLALHPLVLSKGSSKMFTIKAKNWSESARRFLKLCVDAGNAEAYYALLSLDMEEEERKFNEEFSNFFEIWDWQNHTRESLICPLEECQVRQSKKDVAD
ncbi:hypothetical protein SLEP1_g28142 [Rubroshorea leprosula]|uniref:F-box protein n=1 Tax=Rubroshorea leprosula TaxID=152421 RepID=A0AAV5K1E5_9ROSI|nr:hypothetical protein SLEP1_g28142 [Rubroshorea leprosula]